MPFFDMKCKQCGAVTEMLLSFEESEKEIECKKVLDTAPELDLCVVCTGLMTKQVSAPVGFGFNGLGCYHNEKHRK